MFLFFSAFLFFVSFSLGYFLYLGLQPEALTDRDQKYQTLWWVIIATGMRADTVFHCLELKVLESVLRGKSKEKKRMRSQYLNYPFEWSCKPPSFAAERLKDLEENISFCPEAKQCASCLNSWLEKWYAAHHQLDLAPSSTWPRVRMDNCLWNNAVETGRMSEKNFEKYMCHKEDTSADSYRRNHPIDPLDPKTWSKHGGRLPKRMELMAEGNCSDSDDVDEDAVRTM